MNDATHFDAARQARRVTEQAVAWYIEQQEPLGERQRAAFLAWLRASPRHVAEYFAVVQLHGDMKAAAVLKTLTTDELVEQARRDNPVVMFPQIGRPGPRHAQPARRTRAGRLLAGLAATAAAAILAWVGVAHWRVAGTHAPQRVAQSYTGDADAVRSVTLADGTLVELDRHSVIDVHFDEHVRRIDVVRGHALFDVGKDAVRPMLVNVGGHVLQDIGTVFDVRRDAAGDTLTVISGRVRVLKAPAGDGKDENAALLGADAIADLTAGQQIELDAANASPVHPVQIARATAWLPAEIRFQRETIGEVARRFNAYTSKPLVIDNDAIAGKRISGVFHADNPQAFVAYLATLPGVRVVRDAERIRVVAAQPSSASAHL